MITHRSEWQPTPWYLRWRGRERQLVIECAWFWGFVAEKSRHWEYR